MFIQKLGKVKKVKRRCISMKKQNLEDLMKILACPACKGDLEFNKKDKKIVCYNCKLKFRILKGDIPDLLLKDAEKF